MDEEKKISNIENNILNEEAVLKKEEKKVQEINKEISNGKTFPPSNSFKDRAINWLKEPSNLALAAVMIFAIGIRFYYFWMTKNQPLWWDELCYGSLAKNLVTQQWTGTFLIISETHIRPMLFSFLWSLLLRINFNELFSRLFLVLIPSLVSLSFVYLIGKEIYGKRVGIISTFVYGVLWINLFYTGRLLVHMLDLAFLFASIYFFVKSLKQEKQGGGINYRYFVGSLILLCIATLTRYEDGIIFFVYLIILALSKKLFLNKIKFWYSGIIGIIPIILFFIINFLIYRNIFPALFGNYLSPTSSGGQPSPFAFNVLNYIPLYLTPIFFILFLVGIIILLLEIGLGFNFIKNNEKIRGSLLLVLILVVFFSFFIFYMRGAEDRWLFETALSLSAIAAFGADIVYNFVKKYSKVIAIILIAALMIFGAYAQFKQTDPLIKQKEESFLQIKQAFEWIKANTPQDSVIVGSGIEPYAIYYADRRYIALTFNESDVLKIGLADYLVAHAFSTQPDYLNKYIQDNQKSLEPVNTFFFDTQKQQLAVVVYQIKKNMVDNSLAAIDS